MIKDIVAKNSAVLPNSYEIEKLKQVFPQYFDREGNFDFDNFKQNLENNGLSFSNESFGLNFLGKQYARLQAGLDTETVITPDLEHNNKPENKNSENIYIKGDNLHALRHLIKSYAGKVKSIYIDPPYNTGSDGFAYPDRFEYTKEDFERMGMSEEDAERILSLKGKSSHSAWLSFMYPRLLLARDLLSDDGVIFISIDDNEVENLIELCNTCLFGESNCLGIISRATGTTTGQDANKIGSSLDYLLCYQKSDKFNLLGIPLSENDLSRFSDKDEKGKYSLLQLRKTGEADRREDRPLMYYPVISPNNEIIYPIGPSGYESRWRVGEKSYKELLENNMIVWKENREGKITPYVKYYAEGRTKQISNLWNDIDGNKKGSIELKELFDIKVFTNPKPIQLIEKMLKICDSKDSIFLDFFSGSATSAHACLQLNAEDGGNRKFIMVQIPEKLKEDSEGYSAGYRTICDIGIERIKRASQKIKEETNANIDYGFKIYELNEVSENTLDKCESFDKAANLFIPENYIDYFKFGNTEGIETILQTWKVRDGFGFTTEYNKINIGDYNAYFIGKKLYLINPNIKPYIKQLLEYLDNSDINTVIIFGYSFNLDELQEIKVNIKNTFDKNSGREIIVEDRY